MAGYSITTWADGSTPAINAANLNKMEQGLQTSLGFDSIQDLRDEGTPTSVQTAWTRGWAACDDGGGGVFDWLSSSTVTDDGGIWLLPTGHVGAGRWKRRVEHKVLPVQAYGIFGDETCEGTSWDAAIAGMAAIGGGTLVAAGATGDFFATTMMIRLASHVWIEIGQGAEVRNIYDYVAVGGQPQTGVCVAMGEYSPAYEGAWTEYNVNTATEGTNTIVCTTPSDTANFSVGDLVMVISGASDFRQLSKVTAIASPNITLQDRLGRALPASSVITLGSGGSLAFTPNLMAGSSYAANVTVNSHFVEDCGIMGPGILRGPNATTARTAVYHGAIRNLEIHSQFPIYGNAFTHFEFHNLHGTYEYRMMELADGAYDCDVCNIHFDCVAAPTDAAIIGLHPIKGLGVNSVLRNFSMTDNVERTQSIILETDFEYNSRIQDGIIKCTATTAAPTLNIIRRDGTTNTSRKMVYSNLTFELAQSSISRYIQNVTTLGDALFHNIKFLHSGTIVNQACVIPTGCTGILLEDVSFPAGEIQIDPGATGNSLSNVKCALLDIQDTDNILIGIDRSNVRDWYANRVPMVVASTSSLTAVTLATITLPVGTVALPGDYLEIHALLRYAGTNGDKTLRLVDDTGTVISMVYTSAQTGYSDFYCRAVSETANGQNWNISGRYTSGAGVVTSFAVQRAAIDVPGLGWTFEIEGLVANAADTVLVESATLLPKLLYLDI